MLAATCNKNIILFIVGASILFFGLAIAEVQNAEVDIYKDKNVHFTFSPPAGWVKAEMATDTASQVNFRSADKKAGLGVIAQPDAQDIESLFLKKKDYIKDFKGRFPKGKFSLAWDTLGERKVIKVNFEIPGMIKQEQYFFYDQGIRFDLVYGVVNFADFKKYNQSALDAFGTIQSSEMIKSK